MRIVPNQFATSGAEFTRPRVVPTPGWPLLMLLAPALLAFWLCLALLVPATAVILALRSPARRGGAGGYARVPLIG